MTQPDLIDRLVDCSAFGAHDARELCSEAADEIDRLRAALVYEQHLMSRIGTHSDDCWKWGPQHYECAMREIARQREVIETWRAVTAFEGSDDLGNGDFTVLSEAIAEITRLRGQVESVRASRAEAIKLMSQYGTERDTAEAKVKALEGVVKEAELKIQYLVSRRTTKGDR